MKVRWTSRARRDLREIGAYISHDNPNAANRWVARLWDRAEKIKDAPRAGRVVPEIQREDVREVFLKSYRIVYLLKVDEVRIITVIEGHRLFPDQVVKDLSE